VMVLPVMVTTKICMLLLAPGRFVEGAFALTSPPAAVEWVQVSAEPICRAQAVVCESAAECEPVTEPWPAAECESATEREPAAAVVERRFAAECKLATERVEDPECELTAERDSAANRCLVLLFAGKPLRTSQPLSADRPPSLSQLPSASQLLSVSQPSSAVLPPIASQFSPDWFEPAAERVSSVDCELAAVCKSATRAPASGFEPAVGHELLISGRLLCADQSLSADGPSRTSQLLIASQSPSASQPLSAIQSPSASCSPMGGELAWSLPPTVDQLVQVFSRIRPSDWLDNPP
jgi:hypothetical protein